MFHLEPWGEAHVTVSGQKADAYREKSIEMKSFSRANASRTHTNVDRRLHSSYTNHLFCRNIANRAHLQCMKPFLSNATQNQCSNISRWMLQRVSFTSIFGALNLLVTVYFMCVRVGIGWCECVCTTCVAKSGCLSRFQRETRTFVKIFMLIFFNRIINLNRFFVQPHTRSTWET